MNGWLVGRQALSGMVGEVRGRGLMIGIELGIVKATREPVNALRNRVAVLAFERGLT